MAMNGKQEPMLLRQVQTLLGAGTGGGLTDGELLERFLSRRGELSELAFAAMLERPRRMVLGICRRVLADPHDVQDAFQATFLVLVTRPGPFEAETRWRAGSMAWPIGWHAHPARRLCVVVAMNGLMPSKPGVSKQTWMMKTTTSGRCSTRSSAVCPSAIAPWWYSAIWKN